jgi:hypothetical protein
MSRRAKLGVAACLVLAIGCAWFGRNVWLVAFGRYLIGPSRDLRSNADVVVVPGADYIYPDVRVETLDEAARLLRDGRVNRIVMSCAEFYGVSGCELAEQALRDRGYPEVRIEWLRTERLPDDVEADKLISHLRESGTKSAIILLPNYKQRRLGSVYRRLGTRSAIDVDIWGRGGEYDPERWWRAREGQKRFAEELLRFAGLL